MNFGRFQPPIDGVIANVGSLFGLKGKDADTDDAKVIDTDEEGKVLFKEDIIPKVLSAKYHVAIIFVPKNITNEFVDKEKMYQTKMSVKVQQSPGTGSAIKLYEATRTKPLYTDPFKMDTMFLTTNGEKAVIQPTYSEYYDGSAAKDYNVTLEITSILATNTEKKNGINYDGAIRIDKILFIPVLDTEE